MTRQCQPRSIAHFGASLHKRLEQLSDGILKRTKMLASGDCTTGARIQLTGFDLALCLKITASPERADGRVEAVGNTHAATLSARNPYARRDARFAASRSPRSKALANSAANSGLIVDGCGTRILRRYCDWKRSVPPRILTQ